MNDFETNPVGTQAALHRAQSRIAELEGALRTVRQHASTGVCCCGDDMEKHAVFDNHSPRDVMDYFVAGLLGEE